MIESIFNYVQDELTEMMGSAFLIRKKEPLSGGCINHAFRIETTKGDFFLKWNFSCPDDLFVREAESLRELKQTVGRELYVPEVILAKEGDELSGFILMEYLERGHAARQEIRLGQGLAHLHRTKKGNYGFEHDNFCGETLQQNEWNESWIDFFAENRLRFLIGLIQNSRPFSSADLEVMENLIDRLPLLIPENPGASLIHGDLWSGNYMYTSQGPALIDPASYYAHREMELSIMQMFGGFSPKTWSAYQEAFPLEKGWEERVLIYQIYHILNHYCLFGGAYGQQAISLAKRFI
ncbi:fructosamine kinase family protein [Mangrovibacterium sp.]|uniref:fructosamine kinase family protein n=1 Tax=Mangrovibacterium sp. TaxID=1961364 RepID=UPI003569E487